jgi:hypothetical protein
MATVNTHAEAMRYIESHRSTLVMTLSESMPFLDIVDASIPRAKYIHVVRDGFEVAANIALKPWFDNDQLESPIHTYCYRLCDYKGKKYHIPWWVGDGDEYMFLEYSNYEKGLYYWLSLMKQSKIHQFQQNNKILVMDYNYIVNNPQVEFNKAFDFLNLIPDDLTQLQISKVKPQPSISQPTLNNQSLMKEVQEMNEKIGVYNAN